MRQRLGELTKSPYAAFGFFVAGSLSVFLRVFGIWPSILRDEWVYITQARIYGPYEASPIGSTGSFFFEFLYSSVRICGDGFYGCAKGLNVAFFSALVFTIYVFLSRFAGKGWAYLGAGILFVSPLSFYTSFFMPESLFFFLSVLIFLVPFSQKFRLSFGWALGVGLLLALAAMTKAQGYLLWITFSIGLLILLRGTYSPREIARHLLSVWGIAIFSRVTVGLLLAGPRSLTFSGGYFSDLNEVQATQNSQGLTFDIPLISPSLVISLVVFCFGVLIYPYLFSWSRDRASKPESALPGSALQYLFTYSAIWILLGIAWGVYASLTGDDHSGRLLARYFEWLFAPTVFVFLTLVSEMRALRLFPSIAFAGVGLISWYALRTTGYSGNIADSQFLIGFINSRFLGDLVLLLPLVFLAFAILSQRLKNGNFLKTGLLLPMVAMASLGSFYTFNADYEFRGKLNSGDMAGIFANDFLGSSVSGDEVIVLANTRYTSAQTALWINKKGVAVSDGLIKAPGIPYDAVTQGRPWVIAVGDVSLSGPKELEINGVGFSVIKFGNRSIHYFSRTSPNSPVASISGEAGTFPWGIMSDKGGVTIEFVELTYPGKVRLVLNIIPDLVGKDLVIGGAAYPYREKIQFASDRYVVELEFEALTVLEIEVEDAQSGELFPGLGLVSVETFIP